MIVYSVIIVLLFRTVFTDHYKGGTITWRPVNEFSIANPVQILIQEKHTWTYPRFNCNPSLIASQGAYFDANAVTTYPVISCIGSCGSTGGFTSINHITYCTDYNVNTQISTGAYYVKQWLSRSAKLSVGYASNAWASAIPVVNGSSLTYDTARWSIISNIDLTVDAGGVINSSPVTGSLGLIKVIRGQVATIQIPIADWNTGQTLKCRWGNTYNECGDICGDLTQYGATLGTSDCTITWTAQLRPYDVSTGETTSTYVAAIMVEDFNTSSSTIALSSVPLQMIIYVYTPATGACSIAPNITGDRPNRACIGVPINVTLTERILAQVYCNSTLSARTEFVTTSPLWMTKSSVARVAGTSNQFYITLTWTPVDDLYGPQVFCAAPIDGNGAPNLIKAVLVQGSASPVGTVLSNQSIFSIQANQSVHRPNRNGTYISIYLASNNSLAWQADAGYSFDVLYNNPNFWQFNIWDSRQSSTTSTTPTPPTTQTVTTRGVSTAAINNSLTTTGIALTTPITMTTTTATTTTSSSTASTATTTTTELTTTTQPDVNIMSAEQMEEACKQSVAIMTAISYLVMLPVNMGGIFMMFIHLNKIFNPSKIAANVRYINRTKRFI